MTKLIEYRDEWPDGSDPDRYTVLPHLCKRHRWRRARHPNGERQVTADTTRAASRLREALDGFFAATDDYAWNEHDLKLLNAAKEVRAALRADQPREETCPVCGGTGSHYVTGHEDIADHSKPVGASPEPRLVERERES